MTPKQNILLLRMAKGDYFPETDTIDTTLNLAGYKTSSIVYDDPNSLQEKLEGSTFRSTTFSTIILSALRWNAISNLPDTKSLPNPIVITSSHAMPYAVNLFPVAMLFISNTINQNLIECLTFLKTTKTAFAIMAGSFVPEAFGLIRTDILNLGFAEEIWRRIPYEIAYTEKIKTWSKLNTNINTEFKIADISDDHISIIPASSGISRKLSKKEFTDIVSLLDKYLDGEITRTEIANISFNSSYIFGIVNRLK